MNRHHRWTSRTTALVLACGLALPAGPALALPTDPEAKAHLDKGTELFKAGDFDAAIEEYKKGYETQEDPVFLYAWAQAELRQEHCAAAVKLYRKYLETNPPEMSAEAARQGIMECADKLADDETPPPADDPVADPTSTDTVPPDDADPTATKRPRDKKWSRDPLAASLTAVGIAGVGAGIGLAAAGFTERSKNASTYGEFDDRQLRSRNLLISSLVVGIVGVGLLAGGIARFAVLGAREKKKRNRVGAMLSRDVVGLTFSGRF